MGAKRKMVDLIVEIVYIFHMGCYDTVLVPCPKCGHKSEFQSKGGPCLLRYFELSNCPANVMEDINRHAPNDCEKCGTKFHVQFEIVVREAKSVIYEPPKEDDEP